MEATLTALAMRAQAGDTVCADDLLRRLIPDGLRLARAMLRDPAQAEDSVQDASIKAWRKLGRLRGGADPRPWFLGIVANECRSFRRSRWAAVLRTGDPIARSAPHPDIDMSVRDALAQLSADDRLVLVLRYHLDMSADQAALVLRISPEGVRSRAHRAARRLREVLSKEEKSHEP